MRDIVLTILGIGVVFGFIQGLHIAKHDTYCKTEAEWIKTLPFEIQQQL